MAAAPKVVCRQDGRHRCRYHSSSLVFVFFQHFLKTNFYNDTNLVLCELKREISQEEVKKLFRKKLLKI